MRIKLAVITVALLVAMPEAPAKDVDGEFAVFSVGGKRCEEYLRARHGGGRAQHDFTTWLQGYLSAFNLIVPNTYDILGNREFDKVVQWLDNHCTENREASFVNATALLTINLFPERKNIAPNKDNRAKWSGGTQPAKADSAK
ncbi:MAG: hypothetical protein OET44_21365 [Gammaproteobacteria bacterium]|nr:hypothetical protein [Gammaproteobacteria bacterium]